MDGARESWLEAVTILVAEYDEALAFYRDVLGFDVVEDTPSKTTDGRDKRWLVVRPQGSQTGFVIARADGSEQRALVGRQFAGRVGFFLRVADFDARLAALRAAGVDFVRGPQTQVYGRVAVFLDLYGNRWDLLGS